jgi:hypothetical protein
MGDGTRLAIAILILFLAMVAFFFAFHPGGVQGVSDPDTMLQWLFGEFDVASSPGGETNPAGTSTVSPVVNPSNSSDLTNVPGTNTGLPVVNPGNSSDLTNVPGTNF